MVTVDDVRFSAPLYSVAEAARLIDVPASTFKNWVRGYVRRGVGGPLVIGKPIVTATAGEPGQDSVPFIGLAEGMVLAAFRRQGVPLQRIRPALEVLEREIGIEHALASERLFTDGVEILVDYAESAGETPEAASARELVVVRHGQRVFADVVDSYLKRITFAEDGWAERLQLPQYLRASVIVDPRLSFGRPVFEHSGARLADALGMFQAGEDLDTVGAEYGVDRAELEDAVRVASRRAA